MLQKTLKTFFLFSFIFYSCQNNSNNQESEIQETRNITVNIHNLDQKLDFDDFFEYSHHVILQTTDSSLISKIEKLQLRNSKYYILDRSQSILLFDFTGKFIRSFNHKGQSGTEYIGANDMEVDDNGDIYVCDFSGSKIIKYNEKGVFLETIKIPVQTNSFKLLSQGRFAINLQNGSSNNSAETCYNYHCFQNGRFICQAIPFNKHLKGYSFTYGYGKSSFYSYGGKIYTTSTFNDTIYTIQENGCLKPFVRYDFGQKRLALQSSAKEANEYMERVRLGEAVSSLYHFCMFGDYLFVSYDYQNQGSYIISKVNETPVYIGKFKSDKNGLYIIPIIYLSDAPVYQFATIVNAESFEFILKRNKKVPGWIHEISKSVEKEDNPVLIFYKWIYHTT